MSEFRKRLFLVAGLVGLFAACSSNEQGDSPGGAKRALTDAEVAAELAKPVPEDPVALQAEFTAMDEALERDPQNQINQLWMRRLNNATDKRAGLLYTLEVAPKHFVKFYEPAPGMSMHTELLPIDAKPVLKGIPKDSHAAVFGALKPGQALPEVLRAADERTLQRQPMSREITSEAGPQPSRAPESVDDDALVPKHATSSCVHFKDHGACPPGGGSDFIWCACNLSGNTWGQGNAQHSVNNVGVFSGASVSITLQMPGHGGGPWTFAIGLGELLGWYMNSGPGAGDKYCNCGTWEACPGKLNCVWLHRADVTNAAGDGYHWGACFNEDAWYC